MIARVTFAEIDSVRTSVGNALERFEDSVLPELHGQHGYEGAYVLVTPEGKAAVITFWADEEAAQASIESGSYRAQVEKFATVIRSAPGRETYVVEIAEAPLFAAG
jgi:heme-degrading monooxygenase HmoA